MAPDDFLLALQFLFQAFQCRAVHGNRGQGGFIPGRRDMLLLHQLRRFILLPQRLLQPGLRFRHLCRDAVPVNIRDVAVQFQQGIALFDFIPLIHVKPGNQPSHFGRKPGQPSRGNAAGQRQFFIHRGDDGPHDFHRYSLVFLRFSEARGEQQNKQANRRKFNLYSLQHQNLPPTVRDGVRSHITRTGKVCCSFSVIFLCVQCAT